MKYLLCTHRSGEWFIHQQIANVLYKSNAFLTKNPVKQMEKQSRFKMKCAKKETVNIDCDSKTDMSNEH